MGIERRITRSLASTSPSSQKSIPVAGSTKTQGHQESAVSKSPSHSKSGQLIGKKQPLYINDRRKRPLSKANSSSLSSSPLKKLRKETIATAAKPISFSTATKENTDDISSSLFPSPVSPIADEDMFELVDLSHSEEAAQPFAATDTITTSTDTLMESNNMASTDDIFANSSSANLSLDTCHFDLSEERIAQAYLHSYKCCETTFSNWSEFLAHTQLMHPSNEWVAEAIAPNPHKLNMTLTSPDMSQDLFAFTGSHTTSLLVSKTSSFMEPSAKSVEDFLAGCSSGSQSSSSDSEHSTTSSLDDAHDDFMKLFHPGDATDVESTFLDDDRNFEQLNLARQESINQIILSRSNSCTPKPHSNVSTPVGTMKPFALDTLETTLRASFFPDVMAMVNSPTTSEEQFSGDLPKRPMSCGPTLMLPSPGLSNDGLGDVDMTSVPSMTSIDSEATPIVAEATCNGLSDEDAAALVAAATAALSGTSSTSVETVTASNSSSEDAAEPPFGKFDCPACWKSYKNMNGLKYHLTHLHVAQDGMTLKELMDKRKRLLDSPKPYQCPVSPCFKRYKNLNGLKYHIEHAHHSILPPMDEATAAKKVEEAKKIDIKSRKPYNTKKIRESQQNTISDASCGEKRKSSSGSSSATLPLLKKRFQSSTSSFKAPIARSPMFPKGLTGKLPLPPSSSGSSGAAQQNVSHFLQAQLLEAVALLASNAVRQQQQQQQRTLPSKSSPSLTKSRSTPSAKSTATFDKIKA